LGDLIGNWQRITKRAVGLAQGSLCFLIAMTAACASEKPAPSTAGATTVPADASGRGSLVGRAPAGAIITLERSGSQSPLPAGNAVLDQFGKAFVPSFLIVRVGQPVEFRNSEDTDHNVNVVRVPTGANVFSTSTPPFQTYLHTFNEAGRYDVSCDIHPGMHAIILATTAPYAVIADGSGQFSFQDLEPGTYKLTVAVGERQSQRTIDVTGTRLDLGALTL